jgi:ABC-type nickel/cobalt efflux system permease component RcnA
VWVEYRLEVDELTVILDDMAPFKDEVDPAKFKNKGLDYYAEYMRIYAPIIARHLYAEFDNHELTLTCTRRTPSLKDEEGKDLGHLRCDYVFEATAPLPEKWPARFNFRDSTFLLQKGDVRLSYSSEDFNVMTLEAPDEALQNRPAIERRPGDEDRLRSFKLEVDRAEEVLMPRIDLPEQPVPPNSGTNRQSLLLLLQTHEGGFLLVLLFAAAFGAAHALTPGHGKTLVAAYLVGQRGTVTHAIFLGVVTTLTHTGAVLGIAAVIQYFGLSPAARAWIQTSLPLVLGLMIVCFGFFLLLQRFAGKADHVHVGGHHHHHHHGEHDHDHVHVPPTDVTWAGLVLLGVTGGIIPCWDAIVMLVWAIGMNLLDWALPMLLAFSAGLASVLVLLGVMVVKVRGFAESRFGAGKWVKRLPLASAVAIIVLGIWLCFEAIHPDA